MDKLNLNNGKPQRRPKPRPRSTEIAIDVPDGFPAIGDWSRINNDRLTTLLLRQTTPDHRTVVLFYSYNVPIAFAEWDNGVLKQLAYWKPRRCTKTTSAHLTMIRSLPQSATTVECFVGDDALKFREAYQQAMASPCSWQ